MVKIRLDSRLLEKLAKKIGKNKKYVREQISKRAGRLCISSEAFLVIWAKKEKIGTAVYQKNLPPYIKVEIRDTLPIVFTQSRQKTKISDAKKSQKKRVKERSRSPMALATEYLIEDEELYDRCHDLIKAPKNFDRVLREATTVLEDRIRRLSGLKKMKGVNLVGKALNPDPTKAVLKVSDKKFEQEGFFNICKGLMLSFRDTTHHELSDKFTKQDALKFCGFIDSLLAVLNQASKKPK